MRNKILALAAIVACLVLAVPAFGQSAPTPLPGYNVSLNAGYSSVQGNGNNGMFASLAVPVYTFGGAFGKDWDATISARADYFTLTSPANYIVTAGPEFRFQFSRASLLSGTVFQPFANLGVGAARAQCVSAGTCAAGTDTSTHGAFKFGGGLDIPMSASLSLRLLEVDYIHASDLPSGHVVFSNFAQVSAGVGIRF